MTHVHTIYADADMEGVSFRKSIANSDGWVVRIRTTLEDGTPVVMEALIHESLHRETTLQKRMAQYGNFDIIFDHISRALLSSTPPKTHRIYRALYSTSCLY